MAVNLVPARGLMRRRGRSSSGGPRSLRSDRTALALMILLGLFLLVAILAPLVAPFDPDRTDILGASQGPGGSHLLGTDSVGRDIFSRLVFGARLSILGPVLVIGAATTISVALVISSAWIGGRYDRAVARLLNIMFSFPGLILAIIVVAIVGIGFVGPVIAMAIAFVPYISRVLRPVALRERNMAYVSACQLVGMSGWRICTRHLLPNMVPFIRAQVTVALGTALVDLAAISYLGLGVQAPKSEWGLMVSTGQSDLLAGAPWESLSACAAIVIVVVAANTLGERMAAVAGVSR